MKDSIAYISELWPLLYLHKVNNKIVQITHSFEADDAAGAAVDWEVGDDKHADESVQICDSFLQQK